MPAPPSGAQHEISYQDQRATIVEVGGGIRDYRVRDVQVLQSYPIDAVCDGAHGAVLVPWPNRIGDGSYNFDGTDHRLALTEPEKQNAIHGLARWMPWQVNSHAADHIVMTVSIPAQPGYPWSLQVQVEYRLGPRGLLVRTTARNLSESPCPYGVGHHPYLSPGAGLVDDCQLQFGARTRITTDPQRQLPTGAQAVAKSPYDFAKARTLGDVAVDYAFTGLDRDQDGLCWVHLTRPDGWTIHCWLDESYPYLEIYTAHTLAPQRRRRGLAVEPMSCPPDAFRSGTAVVRLEPDTASVHSWGAHLV